MKEFPLPVRIVGPGSQADDDEPLQYLDMPRGMDTFQMPRVPERADAHAARRRRAMRSPRFIEQLERWNPVAGGDGPRLDLARHAGARARDRRTRCWARARSRSGSTGRARYRIQESVFTGIWRVVRARRATARWRPTRLEAAPLPRVAIDAARDAASARLPDSHCPRAR